MLIDLERIYKTYYDRIYNKILGITLNREDTEDILGEVFIKLIDASHKNNIKHPEYIYTWLNKVAYTTLLNYVRKNNIYNKYIKELKDLQNLY